MLVTAMRKSFAVLLVGSWISLLGVDSLETANVPTPLNLQLAGEESHPRGDLANDLLESPDLTVTDQPAIDEPASLLLGLHQFAVDQKAGKIYKVLCVFLI